MRGKRREVRGERREETLTVTSTDSSTGALDTDEVCNGVTKSRSIG